MYFYHNIIIDPNSLVKQNLNEWTFYEINYLSDSESITSLNFWIWIICLTPLKRPLLPLST